MWFRMMLLAMLCNGIGDFGLRLLQEMGYAKAYTPHYLVGWYAAGALGAAIVVVRSGIRPSRVDYLIGLGLGACSVFGQTMLGLALADGVAGSVAYPTAKTGGVFVVALAGLLAFRERVGAYGIAGIVLGIVAVLLLSLE